MTEEIKLKQGRNNVVLSGILKLKEDGGSFSLANKSKNSDWVYSRMDIGVETSEGNVVYCGAMGGCSGKEPVVYTMNADYESMIVNWKDRHNPKILETVSKGNLYRVGVEKDENGKVLVKSFMAERDFVEYLKEHLENGMEIMAKGSYEFQEYEGETRKSIKIQSVFLLKDRKVEKVVQGVKQEVEITKKEQYMAKSSLTVLVEEDSLPKITSKHIEEGRVLATVQVPFYVGKMNGKVIKDTIPFPITLAIPLPNEKRVKVVEKMFKASKNKVTELGMVISIIDGYDTSEFDITKIQLTEELQELVDAGIYTLDEIAEESMVRGNRVSELRFEKPATFKDEDGVSKIYRNEDKYDSSLLYKDEDEEEEEVGTDINLDDNDDDDDEEEDWMADLK